MNYHQKIRKLAATLKDVDLIKRAKKLGDEAGILLIVDMNEIRSIINNDTESEPVTMDDIEVELWCLF